VRIDGASTQGDRIRDLLKRERLFAGMSTGFAAVAVLLSCIGLYGILAYQVTRRTREIGIRMALGANRQQVLWLVLRSACWVVSIGLVVGLPLALGGARVLRSQLWGIEPYDLWTLSGALLLLIGISLFAACLPARRAARVDPMEALRYE
jgi:ABC-type antimicrobial peptide transport system permease subunit